jgi:hypothetical protein
MTRILALLLVTGLVLAPAAVAKGPHVVLTTPREAVEPGKPWEFTVELNEFRHPPRPALIGTRGTRRVRAEVERTPSSIDGAAGFSVTMIFPRQGRWKLLLVAGRRRFAFPAIGVGSGRMPQDYVAFPIGSYAYRQNAGGVFTTDEAPGGTSGAGTLPPRTSTVAGARSATDDTDGGIRPWLLPLLGVVLAGAGVAAVTRRGSR